MNKKMTPVEVANLSDAQVLVMIARESLVKYGSVLPPIPAQISEPAGRPAESAPESHRRARGPYRPKGRVDDPDQLPVDWKRVEKRCPHCGDTKAVDPGFGLTSIRGLVHAQSWCSDCRATTNYHANPRKYQKRRKQTV